MIGTILAVIIAAVTLYFDSTFSIVPFVFKWIIFSSIFLVLALFGSALAFAFSPLQRIEQNFTPRLLDMFRRDTELKLTWGWTLFFVLVSLMMVVALDEVKEEYLFAAWIIGFGITLDVYRHMLQRIMSYFNPFQIIKMFTHQATVNIQSENEAGLCDSIDALAEVAVKALNRHSFSLAQDTVNEIRQVAKSLLLSTKTLAHADAEESDEAVSFGLFYLFERLEMINSCALQQGFEPVISNLINNLGKIAVDAAKCDLSYTVYPLHYMGQFTQDAQDEDLGDMAVRGTIALVEVSRRIIDEVDLQYAALREPFFTVIGQLEEINKEIFRQDKTTNIQILKQPFIELKALFDQEKVANHQDTPIIRADIDRVIGEFTELEAIMNQMPSVQVEG